VYTGTKIINGQLFTKNFKQKIGFRPQLALFERNIMVFARIILIDNLYIQVSLCTNKIDLKELLKTIDSKVIVKLGNMKMGHFIWLEGLFILLIAIICLIIVLT
jgi:hypothetical protein